MRRLREDRGSVLIFTLGILVVCVLAVGVVVDASALFLARRSLQAQADSAALAGAQAVDVEAYYERGAAAGIRLEPVRVRAAVERHVRRASSDVRLRSVALQDDVVVVRLDGIVRPPFSGWLTPSGSYGIEVQAGATLSYRGAG